MLPRVGKIAIAACGLISLLVPHQAVADEALKRRLLEEALRAWAAYQDSADMLEGTFLEEETYKGVNKPPTGRRATLVVRGPLVKAVQVDLGDEGREKAGAINDRYIFVVSRAKGATDYGLAFLEPIGETPTPEVRKVVEGTIEEIKNSLYAPVYLLGQPLATWLRDPAFHVKSVEPEGPEGLVRVDFEYRKKPDDPTEKEERIAPGSLVLDPASHWSLRSYRAGKWWGQIEGTLEYGPPVDGLLFVRQRTERLLGNDKTSMERIVRTETLSRRAASTDEFTLTAFGLPEPNPRAGLLEARLWLIGLAVLFGLAALALRRRGRGRRAAPAGDHPRHP
jgi:hypothetical protein